MIETLIMVTFWIIGMIFVGMIMLDLHPEDAAWWPIHIIKALLRGLYRALFTEWRP